MDHLKRCVFYEILTLRPLFPGSSELDQINRVHNVLGPPPTKILQKFSKHAEIERDYSRHTSKQARLDTIKKVLVDMKTTSYEWYFSGKEPKGVDTLLPTHVSADAKDLLKHLLQYDPDSRPSSHRALQHAYFKELREQAQRAAREKLPTLSGPIVTIVGDEGGLEVAADDNANPVDLTTLGDAKLKLKAPVRRTSEVKPIKDTTIKKPSKDLAVNSLAPAVKLQENMAPNLKEAGEMFSSDAADGAIEKKGPAQYEPRRAEERVKLVQRTIANLKFGGDAVSPSSLPYQKIYLSNDQDGDRSPHSHSQGQNSPTVMSVAQLEEKRRLHLNKRRGGSKVMKVERKKSMTLMSSHDSSSGRGFPLDFIDKTSLTPDLLCRINENRRIAHMQPILSTDLKAQKEREKLSSNFNSRTQAHPPTSPHEFSPRNYQQQIQLKSLQRAPPLKNNHSQGQGHNYEDNPVQYTNTNKQVRDLLASLPSNTKNPKRIVQDQGHKKLENGSQQMIDERLHRNREQPHHVTDPLMDGSKVKGSYSKNQLTKHSSLISNSNKYSGHYYDENANDLKKMLEVNTITSPVQINQGQHSPSLSKPKQPISSNSSRKTDIFNGSSYTNYSPRINHKLIDCDYFDQNTQSDRRIPRQIENPKNHREGSNYRDRDLDIRERQRIDDKKKREDRDRERHRDNDLRYSDAQFKKNYIEDPIDYQTTSPTNIRRVIEQRRKVDLVTTDTDGDGDNYSIKMQKKLESSRRKRRSRFSNDSTPNSGRDPQNPMQNSKNVPEYSPRLLNLVADQQNSNSSAAARISAVVQSSTNKNLNNSANKQVRDILAEMRKRRDMLEDKVTKDPGLNWSKSTRIDELNNVAMPKIRPRVIDPSSKRQNSNSTVSPSISGREEPTYGENYGSSTYRFNCNKNNYQNHRPLKQQHCGSISELSQVRHAHNSSHAHADKLNSYRRRQEEAVYSSCKIKIGRQPSIVKYLESDSGSRLKNVRKSPNQSLKNSYQNSTGAGSKAFPRNRCGNGNNLPRQ